MDADPRGPWPVVVCRAGPGGLTLEARGVDVAVRYHRDGPLPPEVVAFPGGLLAELEGRADTAGVPGECGSRQGTGALGGRRRAPRGGI